MKNQSIKKLISNPYMYIEHTYYLHMLLLLPKCTYKKVPFFAVAVECFKTDTAVQDVDRT